MATQKLTLSVDEAAVERARRYTRRHNTSISRLVSRFLASLPEEDAALPPTVRRLIGVLPGDVDPSEYRRHLEEKHAS